MMMLIANSTSSNNAGNGTIITKTRATATAGTTQSNDPDFLGFAAVALLAGAGFLAGAAFLGAAAPFGTGNVDALI
jgi:hypothetical protein